MKPAILKNENLGKIGDTNTSVGQRNTKIITYLNKNSNTTEFNTMSYLMVYMNNNKHNAT